MSPIVQLAAVDKVFGTQSVLKGIDFTLAAGERILLYGPNGAGKSTLLKIIASLSPATSGTVLFYGSKSGLKRYRAAMAYLGHSSMLYPDLTGAENLTFFAGLRGVRGAEVERWLAMVGLDGSAAHRRVRFYSAGMRQRLAIARLLLHDPDVLLLDEPFNALDGSFTSRFSQWILGKTAVLVTHQLDLGWPLATRAFEVRAGQIRETPVSGPRPSQADVS